MAAPALTSMGSPRPIASGLRFTVDQLNAINVALMLVSAVVAWVLPFELLLASYAVLGPLHYLTEISAGTR